MATIQDKTRAFIATKLNISESEITPEKHLFNDLGADSLDFVELSMILEREFNIKFSEIFLLSYSQFLYFSNNDTYIS